MTRNFKTTATLIIGAAIVLAVFGFIFLKSEKIEVYEKTKYNITYYLKVNNIGSSVATDIPLRLALIKNWEPYQTVVEITIDPEPDNVITDTLDNEFALFTIPALNPGKSFNVTVNAIFISNSIDFNIQKTEIGPFDGSNEKYTLPSYLIESNDPLVSKQAQNLSTQSEFVADYSWNVYEYIVDDIEYEQLPGELGARQTIEHKEGGSAELSNLFVALMRANNIPARRISGWGNHLVVDEVLTSRQFAHGWAEFYLPDYGWIPVDPAWGKNQKFDNFAKIDDDHIVLTKGAGVHFFTRGAFNSPFGDAQLDTDYIIQVNAKDVQNVSPKRFLIVALVFAFPILFIMFTWYKMRRDRILNQSAN